MTTPEHPLRNVLKAMGFIGKKQQDAFITLLGKIVLEVPEDQKAPQINEILESLGTGSYSLTPPAEELPQLIQKLSLESYTQNGGTLEFGFKVNSEQEAYDSLLLMTQRYLKRPNKVRDLHVQQTLPASSMELMHTRHTALSNEPSANHTHFREHLAVSPVAETTPSELAKPTNPLERHDFRDLLQAMGLGREMKPTKNHYDYAAILGGRVNAVKMRGDYLANLQQQGTSFNHIMLVGDEKSEFPMMRDEAEKRLTFKNADSIIQGAVLPISEFPELIDVKTPNKPDRGANTRETIQQLFSDMAEQKAHRYSRILFLSHQPFADYQAEVVKNETREWNEAHGTCYRVEMASPPRDLPVNLAPDGIDSIARSIFELDHQVRQKYPTGESRLQVAQ